MVELLRQVIVTKEDDLSSEERNLLSVGFKNLISSARSAWRTVGAIEQNDKYKEYSQDCANYKVKIGQELEQKCKTVIDIIKKHSLPKATEDDSKTFYLKMIGDYYRYIAENAVGASLDEATAGALDYYEQATKAGESLKPYNSTKLGLALNYSVFYYEVKKDIPKACSLAGDALEIAKQNIDDMDNEDARDALSIVELLKENLSLWQEEDEQD
uniref:14-3-3 domain-containing protein n=1 Tax=Euplotes harpa TaxID=151035 RepID=A0A7S3JIU3_9SPIT